MIWEEKDRQLQKQDLKREERLGNKDLYKLFLVLIKYTPAVLILIDIIHTTLSYYNMNVLILNYLGGISIIPLIHLYLISYVFRFCSLYRCSLYYLTLVNLIALYDYYIGIPMSDLQMFRLYLILFGLFVIIFLSIKYVKNNKEFISQIC